MTTAVVGVGSARTGEVTIASAGHPAPLLIEGADAEFVDVAPGPPLGTGPSAYTSTTITMTPGSTLFCFTDGLVERRTESIDVGMRRLAATVETSAGRTVGELVSQALTSLRTDDAPDDIAALAFRWVPGR
jgi:serine phosphatase RsbU (regulator of sigma subunit)